MVDRRRTLSWLLGAWILADVLAHAGNAAGVPMWGVPFPYGTLPYELTALAYWSLGLALWALLHPLDPPGDGSV